MIIEELILIDLGEVIGGIIVSPYEFLCFLFFADHGNWKLVVSLRFIGTQLLRVTTV
jgi:hypothetical protein